MKTILRTFVLIGLVLFTTAAEPRTRVHLSPATQDPNAVRIAVVGDYGDGSQAETDVVGLIAGWQPDYVVTVGDNNYPG